MHMIRSVTPRPSRRAAGAALAAAIVLAGPLAAVNGQAASACRSDPIVTLSNGVQVQMSDLMFDSAANVSLVAYTLHGPAGTAVVSVSYANTDPGIAETFQYVADNGAGNY